MAEYRVDLRELEQVAIRIQGFVEYLDEQLDFLDRAVVGLKSSWNSEAADAQREAHKKWREGASEMQDGVGTMLQVARRAHGSYERTVTANLRMFGGS